MPPGAERHRFFWRRYTTSLVQSDGAVRWMTQIWSSQAVSRNRRYDWGTAGRLVAHWLEPDGPVHPDGEDRLANGVGVTASPSAHNHRRRRTAGPRIGTAGRQLLRDGRLRGSCQRRGLHGNPLVLGRTFIHVASDGVLSAVLVRALSARMKPEQRAPSSDFREGKDLSHVRRCVRTRDQRSTPRAPLTSSRRGPRLPPSCPPPYLAIARPNS
ncbi:MAG: hypothetical protein JWL61_616 [Gemmatimonadetes bacterium]|nr:hypothetical protein [Gemmatimonadota bacterium]